MSDLPERIWVDGAQGRVWDFDPAKKWGAIGYSEYLRADLAPTVGYSREQVRGAMECLADWVHDKMPSTPDMTAWINGHLATLTPAAPDPSKLVEALERIAKLSPYSTNVELVKWHEEIARTALDEYRKGGRG